MLKLLLRGRWPPTDGPLPPPAPPLLPTPPPRSERFSTPLLPFDVLGSSAAICALKVLATCEVEVSIEAAVSEISTTVDTLPTCILMLTVVILLSSMATLSKVLVLNPEADAVML